jgi:quercetin dioxygenase-like cupin family protein
MELQIGGYERAIRQRANGIEAVEFTWPRGTRTPKHNHHSRGWVWVLRGRVFEVRDGHKTYYEEGDAFLEVANGSTHIVGNDTEDVSITFHVYKPELVMDTFDDDESDRQALRL